MKKLIRQGDVNLHIVKETKGEIVKHNGSFVLARGEVTGSVHLLTVERAEDLEIRKDANGDMYFLLKAEGTLTHTHDHEPLIIQPGIYRQTAEREVDHFGSFTIRKVVD